MQKNLPGKGKLFQNCNRTACQESGSVVFWNKATHAYYCRECAELILQHCNEQERHDIFPKYEENLKQYKIMRRTIRYAKEL